ncbi:DUF4174 domain-containing protein [Neolewinella antarctica]|uniref:DUF4174 domain-containing protein n=1 Tax=Neolewinella antarctica TaxID=442734 RepID=A0ABX0XFW0_9BACT|nr:DUF4174 domain-containing protein [Neolewinella antarctica]NJC28211.1 hypothetical protein [Neolewinella antarctica]
MKTLLITLALLFGTTTVTTAQSLNEFQWKSRLVILFTPDPGDPLFQEQMRLLYGQHEEFQTRRVTFISVTPGGKFENTGRFLNESFSEQYYEKFSPNQYEFTMVLVGLDSNEKYRAANRLTPASVLLSLIDGMPIRERELLQGTGVKSLIDDNKQQTIPAGKRRDH